MATPDDQILLQEFAGANSESAFNTLVERHVDLVYSTALRRTGNSHAAEEITQAVFIVFARKAKSLRSGTVLAGWLYHAARLTAANYVRTEIRRQRREQEAAMQSMANEPEPWPQIAPVLEEAMAELSARDRDAVVLRYFQSKNFAQVGAELGTSEDAARVRVNRALEKMRKFLSKRGTKVSSAILAGALSTNAIQAAPASLSARIAGISVNGAATGGTVALAKATLSVLTWNQYKLPIGVAVLVFLVSLVLTAVISNPGGSKGVRRQLPTNAGGATGETATRASDVVEVISADTRSSARLEPLTSNALFILNGTPGAVAIQPDGKLLIGSSLSGFFVDEEPGTIGWYGRAAMRLNADGSVDRTFYCDMGRMEYTTVGGAQVALLRDGRVFVSGFFSFVDDTPRQGHALLFPDGRVDKSFDPWNGATNISGRIDMPRTTFSSTVVGEDSIVVISRPVTGWESGEDAKSSWAAYRLDMSGRIAGLARRDSPHDARRPDKLILTYSDMPYGPFPEVPLELIRYAARLPDGGAVLATREGPPYGGIHGSLKRFDATWRQDPIFTNTFEADRSMSETSLHVQKDGKILVAGLVGKLNGESFPGLMRLETNGAIDRTFWCETDDAAGGRVMDVAVQEDGRIVICGFFSRVNGFSRERIARLNPDGSLDETFRSPFLPHKEWDRRRFLRVAKLAKKSSAASVTTRETNPNVNASTESEASLERIEITAMNREPGSAVIAFRGQPRGVYVLQAKEAISQKEWLNISTNAATANGTGLLRDPDAAKHPTRFYRIAVP